MIDVQKTLDWLNGLCTVALEESRKGNTLPASQLGNNPLTAYYFNCVHCLRAISPEQWARDYPEDVKALDSQRVFQEQAALAIENTGKIKLLEEDNAELKAQIAALDAKIEALIVLQQPKPRKGKPAPAETEEEGETPAAPPGEGDSEPAEAE